ncbi:hypothetical protein Scep_019178 [Stephania cephalantha]|uniref:Ion transport domain-containing protein n=1 Tax=Stephania cephalantha TaxID=152367 RepID=A0AAP0IAC4_9MAGN
MGRKVVEHSQVTIRNGEGGNDLEEWKESISLRNISKLILPPLGAASDNLQNQNQSKGRVIIPMDSRYRWWEFLMVLMVAYTAWVYPFEIAFLKAAPGRGLYIADSVVDLFFAIDIVLTFFVAYIDPTTHLLNAGYFVDAPLKTRKLNFNQETSQVHDVIGSFVPGVLTASVNGVGKIASSSVPSKRKIGDSIKGGDTRIDGYPRSEETSDKSSYYNDGVHSPQINVEETMVYSDW